MSPYVPLMPVLPSVIVKVKAVVEFVSPTTDLETARLPSFAGASRSVASTGFCLMTAPIMC